MSQRILLRLGAVFALALGFIGSTPAVRAGVTLAVNGGTAITASPGDPITFTWTATEDIRRLERGWGASSGTELPARSGSEAIRASNPLLPTVYQYSVTGYDGTGAVVRASVQVSVNPAPVAPAFTPIVWQPSLPNFQLQTLTFYVVPDAQIGVPYSAAISASGRAPITYAATSLPQGLTIVGNTITGTPTIEAAMQGGNFTLTATDADGITSATLARMMTPVLPPRVVVPVTSPVVFDSGAALLTNGYTSDAGAVGIERAVSGFMLPAATIVTGVRVWGTYLGRVAQTDAFTLKFYARGPSPLITWPSFPAVGQLLGTFSPTSVKRAKTGRASFGAPDSEYVYDLSFAGLPLQANTLYYVSVVNTTEDGNWLWMTAENQGYPNWGAYSFDGGVTFPGGSAELAFQLSNAPVVVAPPPPPPSTTVTYKLDVKRNGKGTIAATPLGSGSSGAVYAAGTVVTLTAVTDPSEKSSVWRGWTGAVTSLNPTITVTVTKDLQITANFR